MYILPSGGGRAVPAEVRVDQAGYLTGESKPAYVMGSGPALAGAGFAVLDQYGHTALSGRLGPRTGSWNQQYGSVRGVDLSRLTRAGTYRLKLTGTARGMSPAFRVAAPGPLMEHLAAENVRYFRSQRDGADVTPGDLGRKPSHLTDRSATVYAEPRYDKAGSRLTGALVPDGGPVDVSGGWFDAGDYLKFTHTASYATAELLLAERALPGTPGLAEEARYGLGWLDRMWDGPAGTLYAQVGIGVGNEDVRSDHDIWRLPEADDAMDVGPGEPGYYVKYRPVFRSNAPGEPISPNLAGRVAAVFALAAQSQAAADPAAAHGWLAKAAAVYARAGTGHSGPLTTTFPGTFYQEDAWQDDMEFGAVELALAARALGDSRAAAWQRDAGSLLRGYLASGDGGSLGAADVSALAHADLLRLSPKGADAELAREDLRRQLTQGERRAAADPFGAGAAYDGFDAVAHTFGLVATARLYARATGDHRYDAFAAQQRGWALGANAWGTGFMIGAGEVFPHCPSHQVASLAGSPDGTGRILRGAVVNGPNAAATLADLNASDKAPRCATDPRMWQRFDGRGAAYRDDSGAWPTVEPADDFTSVALLAFALTAK